MQSNFDLDIHFEKNDCVTHLDCQSRGFTVTRVMTGPDVHTGPFRSIRAEMLGFVELIPQGPMKASREGETRSQLD